MDSTGQLWFAKALACKPVGMFFSTAMLGGGQESIVLSTIPFFAAHGMIYVPLGYPDNGDDVSLLRVDEVHGGSCYGSGTYSGMDGKRQATESELKLCETQGERFVPIVTKLSSSLEEQTPNPTGEQKKRRK